MIPLAQCTLRNLQANSFATSVASRALTLFQVSQHKESNKSASDLTMKRELCFRTRTNHSMTKPEQSPYVQAVCVAGVFEFLGAILVGARAGLCKPLPETKARIALTQLWRLCAAGRFCHRYYQKQHSQNKRIQHCSRYAPQSRISPSRCQNHQSCYDGCLCMQLFCCMECSALSARVLFGTTWPVIWDWPSPRVTLSVSCRFPADCSPTVSSSDLQLMFADLPSSS